MAKTKKILMSKELEGVVDEQTIMPIEKQAVFDYISVNILSTAGTKGLTGTLVGLRVDENNLLETMEIILKKEDLSILLDQGIRNIRELKIMTNKVLTYTFQDKTKRSFEIKPVIIGEPIYSIVIKVVR